MRFKHQWNNKKHTPVRETDLHHSFSNLPVCVEFLLAILLSTQGNKNSGQSNPSKASNYLFIENLILGRVAFPLDDSFLQVLFPLSIFTYSFILLSGIHHFTSYSSICCDEKMISTSLRLSDQPGRWMWTNTEKKQGVHVWKEWIKYSGCLPVKGRALAF